MPKTKKPKGPPKPRPSRARGERKTGRPTKYTPEVLKRACEAVALGGTLEDAAGHAGINQATLHEYKNKFPEFAEALERSIGERKLTLLAVIQKASARQWTAAAWWLERKYPYEFGRRVLELPSGGGIQSGNNDESAATVRTDPRTVGALRSLLDAVAAFSSSDEPGRVRDSDHQGLGESVGPLALPSHDQ